MSTPLVVTNNLSVRLLDSASAERKLILKSADLQLSAGQALGITGESGGGKSTLALALAGLLPPSAMISAANCHLFGRQIITRTATVSGSDFSRQLQMFRGKQLFYISQDARSALVPYRRLAWHLRCVTSANSVNTAAQLERLRLTPPEEFGPRLPHELSTGQCQRVQLALAEMLAQQGLRQKQPFLLIADEPLASVDAPLVKEFGERLRNLVDEGMGLLIISHQLQLLRQLTDRVLVVDEGIIAEEGPTTEVLNGATAKASATRRLLAVERCTTYVRSKDSAQSRPSATPSSASLTLLQVKNAAKRIGGQRLGFPDLTLRDGERLGLFGASGCGKTTFARAILALTSLDQGSLNRFGNPLWQNNPAANQRSKLWRRLQFVPQDADLLFDPQGTLGESLAAAVKAFTPLLTNREAWRLCGNLIGLLHLPSSLLFAPPGSLSGGQRKRAALARSLAAVGFLQSNHLQDSRVVILDEPTVGIDLFLQAVMAETLLAAQQKQSLLIW